jgi:hypothetical protein
LLEAIEDRESLWEAESLPNISCVNLSEF